MRRFAQRTFHAVAFIFRSKFGLVGATVRRFAGANLPCPAGRLHSFSVLSSAWLEQPFAGSRGEPSMRVRSYPRSKLGLVGATVRRFAGRTFHAVAFFFRSKFGSVGATVRRFAQRTFHARRGGCVRIPVPSSAWSEQPCAGSRSVPSMPKEPLFSIFHFPFSTFHSPLSTFHSPLSTFNFPLSAFHSPLSSLPLRRFFLCVSIQ